MSIPEFPIFLSQVFDVTQTDSIVGFQLTYNKKINQHLNILQNLSIMPRVYPVEMSPRSGEEKLPGNYQLNLNGDFYGMPFAFGISKNSPPTFLVTIPVNNRSSVNFVGSIPDYSRFYMPDFGSSLSLSGKKYTSRFDIDISNFLQNISFTLYSTYYPVPKYGFGTSIMIPVSSNTSTSLNPWYSFAFLIDKTKPINIESKLKDKNNNLQKLYYFQKFDTNDDTTPPPKEGPKYCTMLHFADKISFVTGSTYSIEPKTVTGVTFKVDLGGIDQISDPLLYTEFRIGLQRSFLMSRMSAVISSTGIVQSNFQRNIKDGVLMSAYGCADNAHKIYTVGLGFVLDS